MPVNELRDVDVAALSIVTKGANRQVFFLRKSAEDADDLIELPGHGELIKTADWSAVYCVVAAPGVLEQAGQAGDNSIPDRWASEDEIRKAAHRFVENGGLVTKMHESLAPYGQLVENAVALDDFTVNGQTIRKGSWYVAIKPSAEGRKAIEDGEFTGVSIQGTGIRKKVQKAADDLDEAVALLAKAEAFTVPGTANVSAADRKKVAGLARHYLAKPHPFTTCVRDQRKHRLSEDHAKRRCAVLLDTFDPKRQRHSVRKASDDERDTVGGVKNALRKIGERLGVSDEDLAELDAEDVTKAVPTFAERMAQRELSDELPDAMDVLRSVIWGAFHPYGDDADDTDPKAVISDSLDEFKSWALELLDRVPMSKLADQTRDEVEKARASNGDGGNVGLVEGDAKNLSEQITSLDTKLDELPDRIAKAIKGEDSGDDKGGEDTPTIESLSKQVDELTESVGKITKALGKGGSTQPPDTGDDRQDVKKSDWTPKQAPAGVL